MEITSIARDGESGNLRTSRPHLADQEAFDYRLTAQSPAIDRGVGVDPNSGRSVVPSEVYLHPTQVAPRPKRGRSMSGHTSSRVTIRIPRRYARIPPFIR